MNSQQVLNTDIAALGTSPIPGENPAGQDARYEPEYAAVLAEIEKLSFSGQGAAASWPLIEEKSVAILADKAKDIQIAVYLAVALWHNRGIEGMLVGLRMLSGLLGTFWETGWPPLKRMRGRVNAIDWWHERAYAFLQEEARNTPVPASMRKNLLEEVTGLDEILNSLLPDAAPLRDVVSAVQRLAVLDSDENSARDDTSFSPDQPPPQAPSIRDDVGTDRGGADAVTSAPAATDESIEDDPDNVAPTADVAVLRRRFVEGGQNYLKAALPAEPANAALWRLSRLVLWCGIAIQPADENNLTLLPAPDTAVLAQARRLLDTGNALAAALTAEDFSHTAPFCLDAQMLIFNALHALGPQFSQAAQAVREECGRFVTRLPGLEKLCFNDGSPFVGPETAAWLRTCPHSESLSVDRFADKPASPLTTAPEDSPAGRSKELFEASARLLAQNRLAEALDMLDAAKTDSLSENLRLKVGQLRLLCEAGENTAALALAESLLAQVTARDLDNWDPRLALKALNAARVAFSLFEGGNTQRLREVLGRIAAIHPSAALG
ncbi:MAG: type VI secretion system protein TssA [Desulfovibrio sp.]|nr:type VI secretion system protein TssA [Desulfovibrio sp.]